MARNGTNLTEREHRLMNDVADQSDTDRVLHVRIGEGDTERVEETLRALDQGDTPKPYFEVVLEDPSDVQTVTRPTTLALLSAIAQHEPESITATASLVDRDVRQVHENLEDLEQLGIIEFEVTGNAKKPRVWYDRIEVDYSLTPDPAERDRGAEVADG